MCPIAMFTLLRRHHCSNSWRQAPLSPSVRVALSIHIIVLTTVRCLQFLPACSFWQLWFSLLSASYTAKRCASKTPFDLTASLSHGASAAVKYTRNKPTELLR